MELNAVEQKQQAHAMIDLLMPDKLPAAVSLLEGMLDPVARAIANAPADDEPLTADDVQALAEAREWLKHNQPIPHAQVLAELGITMQEIEDFREPV